MKNEQNQKISDLVYNIAFVPKISYNFHYFHNMNSSILRGLDFIVHKTHDELKKVFPL